MWTGSLSFGLVNIPIKLLPAVREQRVAFHLLHDQDMVRLKRKMVSTVSGREVHPEHIVKGFEVDKGRFVVVRQEEIEGCSPEKTKSIEISDFVDLADIDPLYYDRPYYVLPQAGSAKSYRLLVEAMRRAKKVGVARFVFHEKEYLAAIRPIGEALCLETMHFHAEVVPPDDAVGHVDVSHVAEREAKAARQLVESNTVEFKPSKYHDEHLKALRKVLEKKAEQHKVVKPPAEKGKKAGKKPAGALDLMAALEASLAAAKHEAGADDAHRRRRKSA
jgi:DNA end-binding protein Ku